MNLKGCYTCFLPAIIYWSYELYTIKFSYAKCAIQLFLVHLQNCAAITVVEFQSISISSKSVILPCSRSLSSANNQVSVIQGQCVPSFVQLSSCLWSRCTFPVSFSQKEIQSLYFYDRINHHVIKILMSNIFFILLCLNAFS